jgi:selenium metabolism protein YedF
MRIVDTKGQLCPAPLIATKRALKETPAGGSFILLIDNKVSFNNVSRFLNDNNTGFQVIEEDGVWKMTVTRSDGDLMKPDAEAYCAPEIAHFDKGDFVVAISSDKMGEGDEVLGRLLMVNFIKALKDLDKLPYKVVFYNNGVKLGVKDSPVIGDLKDLEKMGVELLFCATCVNHYSLETLVTEGTLSNMYVIAALMASAGNVVKP